MTAMRAIVLDAPGPATALQPGTDLDWGRSGALPEVLQTAWGSLTVGVGLQTGDSLLVRGGTYSVGLMAAILAKRQGTTLLSTTRRPERADQFRELGVEHVQLIHGT